MDAADDPGDAQLFWSKSSRSTPTFQQRTKDVPPSKVIFDIYEPVEADSTLVNVPDKVQSFDLAHSDEDKTEDFEPVHLPAEMPDDLKQFQDDFHTPSVERPLWADVSDGDDENESLSDVIAEEATAEFCSQEHQSKRVPITSTIPAHVDFREFAKATLPDVFPASDADSASDDEALDDEALLDAADSPAPCITAADAPPADASKFVISLADALGLPEVSGEDDSNQGDRAVDGGPLPLRLPTVTGLQSSLEQLVDVSIGPNRPQHQPDVGLYADVLAPRMQTVRTQYGPLPQQHLQTPGTLAQHAPQEQEKSSLQTLQTQCGQLPQQHLLSPCAPGLSNAANHIPGEALDFEGFTIFDLDDEGRLKVLDSQGHGISTQCGPLPQHQLQSTQFGTLPQSQSFGFPTSRTQCGHLPQQQPPRASTSPEEDGHLCTQDAPCTEECLLDVDSPGSLLPSLDGMQDSLTHLVNVSSEPFAALSARYAALDAYAAATKQYALALGLTETPFEPVPQPSLQPLPSRTQSGPLPQELGPSPRQAAKDRRRNGSAGKGTGKAKCSSSKPLTLVKG